MNTGGIASRLASALSDRYRVERELGAGGMATVYLARDLKHDRDVALKVLRPDLAAILGADRFLAEIRISARLDHPHILTLIDSGAADGLLYYVLPFVRGESLRARLVREGPLPIKEAVAITRQIAGALEYAHRLGVVHRDIKPENILFQEGEAVLADFGIALALREAGGNRLTQSGLSLGTPQYMSPEQATGDRQLDARSDIYSLGAVLYEMLVGEPPHAGPTAHAVIAKLLTERPTRVRVLRDTIPQELDDAIDAALAKLPADRPATASEFAASLVLHEGRPARQPSRPRAPTWVAGLTIGLGLAVAAVFLLRTRDARPITPERVQLTFTGNARTPSLSADGRRLAYSTRECDSAGRCTSAVVIHDIDGAGSTTVLRGWASVGSVKWMGDGRYLLVDGFEGSGGRWGQFAVPTLGGAPRWLGSNQGRAYPIGSSDTVLAVDQQRSESRAWVRWITIADGVTRDSLSLAMPDGTITEVWPFPDGNRLMIARWRGLTWTLSVSDRSGRVLDSLQGRSPERRPIGLSHDGRAALVAEAVAASAGTSYDLLAFRLTRSGKFPKQATTVLTRLRGRVSVTLNGTLLNADGPPHYEVWALERRDPADLRFRTRKLASTTADPGASLAPRGDRIIMGRPVAANGGMLTQYIILPFDGGAEQLVGAPTTIPWAAWTPRGDTLFGGRERPDSIDLVLLDVTSARSRPWLSIARRRIAGPPTLLPDGGFAMVLRSPTEVARFRSPGLRDTTFAFPDTLVDVVGLAAAPDGRALAVVGWDAHGDSVVVNLVSLTDGRISRLASFFPDGASQPFWFRDGTLIVPIEESAGTMVWYRVPVGGGKPVRLGAPPISPATYRLSADGKRAVATTSDDRPDVYLIRNFAELLKR